MECYQPKKDNIRHSVKKSNEPTSLPFRARGRVLCLFIPYRDKRSLLPSRSTSVQPRPLGRIFREGIIGESIPLYPPS